MPGLLDIFAIGFESDSLKNFEADLKRNKNELDKYEKKVKETEDALKKLEEAGKKDSVEYKKLQKTLEEAKSSVDFFKKSVETLEKSGEHSLLKLKQNFYALGKTVARLAIVGATIKKSLDFYEQGEQLGFLAQKASVAADKLQTLGLAARRYGGTTEGTAGTLENLRNQYQSLRMGQGGGSLEQAAFKYGVGISSDPEKMLENVARRMETLKSDAAKWDLANTLGIDEGTARLLMQGVTAYRKELERAQKYKLYTKEDLERMRQYRQINLDIRMGIDSMFASIARMLLPAITAVSKVIRSITDWMAEHEGATKLIATIVGVTAVVLSAKTAITLLAAAFKFLGLSIMGTPVGWIIAGITAIIAIVNDLIVFMQGGESIIGSIFEFFGFNIDEIRKNLNSFFSNIQNWINSAVNWFKNLGGEIAKIGDFLASLWDKIPEPLKKIFGSGLIFGLPGLAFSTVKEGSNYIQNLNQNPQNSIPEGSVSNYYSTQSQNETAVNNTKNIQNSNSKNMNINTMNINVKADNPKEFAKNLAVMSELDDGLE